MSKSNADLIDLVENGADVRGDPKIPRDFITAALEKIEQGEPVERYPIGTPTLIGVYTIAAKLYADSTAGA